MSCKQGVNTLPSNPCDGTCGASALETVAGMLEQIAQRLRGEAGHLTDDPESTYHAGLTSSIIGEVVDLVDKLIDLDPCPPPELQVAGEVSVEHTLREGGQ